MKPIFELFLKFIRAVGAIAAFLRFFIPKR